MSCGIDKKLQAIWQHDRYSYISQFLWECFLSSFLYCTQSTERMRVHAEEGSAETAKDPISKNIKVRIMSELYRDVPDYLAEICD